VTAGSRRRAVLRSSYTSCSSTKKSSPPEGRTWLAVHSARWPPGGAGQRVLEQPTEGSIQCHAVSAIAASNRVASAGCQVFEAGVRPAEFDAHHHQPAIDHWPRSDTGTRADL
jgi:hypothetical protein